MAADTLASSLASALALLDAFHHRNHNQHRVALWWARFDHLRRALRKLHGAVVAADRRPGRRDQSRRLVADRAEVLGRRVVPQAYM